MTDTIVSFSEVFKYQTCQRQYYYNFTLNLRPVEESTPISMGVKGHGLLQDFFELMREGSTKEEALELMNKKAKKVIQEISFTETKALLTAWTLVDNYIRETDFTSDSIFIENRFLLPASCLSSDPELADVQIGFTPDLVVQRKGEFIDIEDAKFVGRAWGAKKLNRFPQLKLYQIFLEHMNYKVSRTVLRFFNVTTGKLTAKPYTATAVEKEILTRDFIGGVKDVLKFRQSPEEVKPLAMRTMNYTACTYCYFEFPCTLEAEGKDVTRTLDNLYVKGKYDYNR